jgi:hypothetical protein
VKLLCATVILAATTQFASAGPASHTRAASSIGTTAEVAWQPSSEADVASGPRLLDAHAIASPLPAIEGPGECGASDVVQLKAIFLEDGRKVGFQPAVTLQRTMAEAVVDWVREDVGKALESLGARLATIESYGSYSCRGRNNIVGAKLSEHGRANALDVHGFKLTDGKSIVPTDALASSDFRKALRQTACERFNTVLGPGSDGYHEDHIHLDLLDRPPRHFRLCQWEVRKPEEATESAAITPLPPHVDRSSPEPTGANSHARTTKKAFTIATTRSRSPGAKRWASRGP